MATATVIGPDRRGRLDHHRQAKWSHLVALLRLWNRLPALLRPWNRRLQITARQVTPPSVLVPNAHHRIHHPVHSPLPAARLRPARILPC